MTDEPSAPGEAAPRDSATQDLAWMQRVKQGDTEAFRLLIEAHQQRVIAAITRMLGDEMEAEDVAQQVFIRVWKSAPRYEPTAKFTTWLYTILRHLVFNESRRRKRHRAQPLERSTAGEAETRPLPVADPTVKSPDAHLLDEEMQGAIQSAIDSLPETQRLAIILRRYDEFSYEEIGEIMGLSVPALKSTLFRARAALRERLRQYLDA